MNTLRIGAAVAVLATVTTASSAGASVRATADRITNRETVQADLNPDGSVKVARLFSQLVIDGNGTIRVVDPTATKNLRDLDGFSKPKTSGGAAIWTVDVNGRAVRRTVADFPKSDLPVDVSVTYLLNGKNVRARDVVGKSGTLTVTYHVKNTTEQPTEVTYVDGRGTTRTAVVRVPTPYVGQLQTTLPARFVDVDAPRADVAGDGRGGNLLTWTMVLFAPIGEVDQEFGWTAQIRNGVVPKASVQVVPVPPKRKPELKFGEDGFSNGAAQATALTAGAGEIDANVVKLRDGAADLLDGLSRLATGANDLKTGLAGQAAPGAVKLADGLDQADAGGADLRSGLGRLADGAQQVAGGLHQADDGSQQALSGSQDLAAGAGLVSGGAGQVAGGAAALATGLHSISAGLATLAGVTGLPAARAGAIALQAGVAAILAGIGDAATTGTILNGLAQLGGGLTALGSNTTGLPAAKAGVDAVNAGLASAKTALQGLQAAVGGSVAEISGALAVLGCPGSLNPVCPLLDSALSSSHGLSTVTLPGLAALETGTGTAIGGLGLVSGGLATAIAGVTALSAGTALVTGGVNAVKLGLDHPGGLGVVQGLDALVAGLTAAVTGVTALNAGAASAATGADTLASGAATVAGGAAQVSDGAGLLANGVLDLADGVRQLDNGATDLATGATTAANGAGDLLDGLDQLKTGAHDLSTGIGTAASGAGQLADGLGQAKDGGAQIHDGAGRLSKEGTSVLEKQGNDTAAEAGLSYARLAKLDEKAAAGGLPYGAPAGGEGSAAYLLTVNAADAQGTEDAGRAALAIGLLVVASVTGALVRRRVSAAA